VSTYFYLVRRKILFLVKHFLLLRGTTTAAVEEATLGCHRQQALDWQQPEVATRQHSNQQ
jgi:hypothetical protein